MTQSSVKEAANFRKSSKAVKPSTATVKYTAKNIYFKINYAAIYEPLQH